MLSRSVSGLALSSLAALAAAGFVVFAVSFPFARKEQATGHLAPVAGWSRVTAQSFAVVRHRVVEAGDPVEAGDALYELASGDGLREGLSLERKLLQDIDERRKALQARLKAIAAQFENDRALQQKERKAGAEQIQHLEAELASLESRLAIARRQQRDGERLRASGALADADLLALADRVQSRAALVAATRRELTTIQSAQDARAEQSARLKLNREVAHATVVEQLHALSMEETQVRVRDATHVLAPRSGRIASVRIGAGDWVRPGDVLLDILPSDVGLKARLFVSSAAMGLVEVGQEVRVYLDAFPYERHGAHSGRVLSISETTLGSEKGDKSSSFFRIDVEFPDGFNLSPGQRKSLRPGMTVSADLVRGYGTLLDWLLEPMRGTVTRL
ncbi:MAG: HlyD family efflux transporter periplasmic adaptor subunit [Gammaproteobacteria bacterium]|nr:HlyD family efflux transporter periplasmic adaptor subunit [Gammaproteobacteria bacterium]